MGASEHTFHVPVMGTAFTIDTPLRVAKYGISAVMSIGDDELCETMREFYSREHNIPFEPIVKFEDDYRSRRITAYLDMAQDIVDQQFSELKESPFESGSEIVKYCELLPSDSVIRGKYDRMAALDEGAEKDALQSEIRSLIRPGTLDVNIMTKLDRDNYSKEGELMGPEFSDALSALRGYAKSRLASSIIFSAGFNRRLYAYIENFDDFYPDETGYIKKKIVVKVSDYRSSLTQGRFLAKKGIWISEHRIESGLNCGGHAFATQGMMMGPILEEFKQHRGELGVSLMEICNASLAKKGRHLFQSQPELLVTVQGGIGTFQEDQFLQRYFEVDGTGWATPFLLVPEVTTLDMPTRDLLSKAKEKDFYLSPVSPLGIPFNTVKGTDSEKQKLERFEQGRPGSPCPKAHLVSNTEFTKKPICTASVLYQKRKIEQLKKSELSEEDLKSKIFSVIQKACLCEDLAAGALLVNDLDNKRPLKSAVCSGPNMAYFSKKVSLAEMLSHIYGRMNLLNDTYRPNMFMKELRMYIEYLTSEIKKALPTPSERDVKYLCEFKDNLFEGIEFYKGLIPKFVEETKKCRDSMKSDLSVLTGELESTLKSFSKQIPELWTRSTAVSS